MKTIFVVGWILLSALPASAQTDWEAVLALAPNQQIHVTTTTSSKPQKVEFESATPAWLVVTKRSGQVAYIARPDVKEVSHTIKHGSRRSKWTVLGLIFGGMMGYGAGQGAGLMAIPIDIGIFGGLGAWMDHKNADEERSVVYVMPPPQNP
jgi:hypothetical protein